MKEFKDNFDKLTRTHRPHTVFTDFCEATAIALSNVTHMTQSEEWKKREERYLAIAKKYGKDMNILSDMFALLTKQFDEDFKNGEIQDRLGILYSELGLTNDRNGQVFTPTHVCELMAELSFDKETVDNAIKTKGFTEVYEPCCGGGALVLGYVKTMLKKGYNPQNQLLIRAGDIDLNSVYMCYIQLSLLGIPAVISHRDEILVQEYSTWYTVGYYLNKFGGVL
ncbi:MAG: SAM-dependent methyltransferase [Oscillospiraceae bacterium]|jgi:type I restriction-modification system DNA methylase subunit|nr:SAM-dependent methyltransferase [Oscillospiraceae bacterium]